MNFEKIEGDVSPKEHQERYSEDFIERVKAEFPPSSSIYEALDSGNEWVGRFLDEERHFPMTQKDIDKAIQDGNAEEVIKEITKAIERADRINKLYCEWGESLPEITEETNL
ncbi:MAG: hypothetical protein U9N04_00150 [Patescibacteria group bacterium]|nr:hypothetical protein [Patescibacteria group bacterium]